MKGPYSLKEEEWREYDVPGVVEPYRIYDPFQLWIGDTTHRVLDAAGIVHCVPRNVVLRWKPRDVGNPVQF